MIEILAISSPIKSGHRFKSHIGVKNDAKSRETNAIMLNTISVKGRLFTLNNSRLSTTCVVISSAIILNKICIIGNKFKSFILIFNGCAPGYSP